MACEREAVNRTGTLGGWPLENLLIQKRQVVQVRIGANPNPETTHCSFHTSKVGYSS